MRTSPLGPISPPWAPARAASPAGNRSGKQGLKRAWQVPTRKEEGPQAPPSRQQCYWGTRCTRPRGGWLRVLKQGAVCPVLPIQAHFLPASLKGKGRDAPRTTRNP